MPNKNDPRTVTSPVVNVTDGKIPKSPPKAPVSRKKEKTPPKPQPKQ